MSSEKNEYTYDYPAMAICKNCEQVIFVMYGASEEFAVNSEKNCHVWDNSVEWFGPPDYHKCYDWGRHPNREEEEVKKSLLTKALPRRKRFS